MLSKQYVERSNLRVDLSHFDSDLTYYVLGGGIRRWDYGTTGWSGFADNSAALRRAFAKNAYMPVFIAEGMYVGLTEGAHKNVTRDHFNAGHMVYIDNESLGKLKAGRCSFYAQGSAD